MGPFSNDWTSDQIEEVLSRGDANELVYVPIVVSMNAPAFEAGRAEDICVDLSNHADPRVRGNALKGLGHLARITGKFSREDSIDRVREGLSDPDESVRGHAQDAASDVYMFTGLKISE